MEHLHSRLSYSQWRLQLLRQLFAPSGSYGSTFLPRRAFSTSNNRARADAETPAEEKSNSTINGADTADSTIPLSQSLPQSPLITDPHPGRELRHRKKRRPTPNDLSDLSKNPWAVALASPVRMCNATQTRLPKAFLTEWGLVEEPATAAESTHNQKTSSNASRPQKANNKKSEDRKLWFLPTDLLKDSLVNPVHAGKGRENGRSMRSSHLKVRLIDRLPMVQFVTNATDNKRQKRYAGAIMPLMGHRLRAPQGPLTKHDEGRIVLRSDMPDYVSKLKRREALEKLKQVSDTFKSQKTHSKVWISFDASEPLSETTLLEGLMTEELARKRTFDRMKTGAFIIFGKGSDSNADEASSNSSEFVALPESGMKVPVFDLTRLFSQAELEELRAYHPRFQRSAAFLTSSNGLMMKAILELWSLQGFIREPAKPYIPYN